MWDSKLATRRQDAEFAIANRKEAGLGFSARRATRALERSERQTHKRLLSAALRDQRVLAVVYGEGGEEDSLPIWNDPFTGAWWRFEDLEDLVDLYLP